MPISYTLYCIQRLFVPQSLHDVQSHINAPTDLGCPLVTTKTSWYVVMPHAGCAGRRSACGRAARPPESLRNLILHYLCSQIARFWLAIAQFHHTIAIGKTVASNQGCIRHCDAYPLCTLRSNASLQVLNILKTPICAFQCDVWCVPVLIHIILNILKNPFPHSVTANRFVVTV